MSTLPSLLVNGLGVAAAVCSMGSFIPQAAKIIRERNASSVSVPMYVITIIGFGLWTAYGVALTSWPLIVSNLISLGLASLVLVLKVTAPRGAT